MFGKRYVILNVLQLSAAFAVRYYFLWSLSKRLYPERSVTKGLLIWGSLGMVTFPFAMQCHLAALPCSLISSLFLLMLSYLFRDGKGKKRLVTLLLAAVCAGLMMGLSGRGQAECSGKQYSGGNGQSFGLAYSLGRS